MKSSGRGLSRLIRIRFQSSFVEVAFGKVFAELDVFSSDEKEWEGSCVGREEEVYGVALALPSIKPLHRDTSTNKITRIRRNPKYL